MSFRESMVPLSIIVAIDAEGGFGKDGGIPWINEPFAKIDLKHFKDTTNGNICIMGRKTYQDMLEFRSKKTKKTDIKEILPGRECYVITSDSRLKTPGAKVAANIREVVQNLKSDEKRTVFILGGERMYIEALSWATTIHMTVIDKHYKCDKFFPIDVLKKFEIKEGRKEGELRFITYQRVKW